MKPRRPILRLELVETEEPSPVAVNRERLEETFAKLLLDLARARRAAASPLRRAA